MRKDTFFFFTSNVHIGLEPNSEYCKMKDIIQLETLTNPPFGRYDSLFHMILSSMIGFGESYKTIALIQCQPLILSLILDSPCRQLGLPKAIFQ
jgi:hypothetical protein